MPPRILIIDDEEEMCWALARAMGKEGYTVTTVTNPRQGLEMFRRDGADTVLLDLVMPEMDGLTLLRHIRTIDHKVPVIMITGHGSLENALDLVTAGATGYVTKPFNVKDIREIVRRLLQGKGGSGCVEAD
ncbi:MAG: response regulator [Thermoanaerobacterales bacterium]|nr:response regulator [Thermoanaerobacterales bacterium]